MSSSNPVNPTPTPIRRSRLLLIAAIALGVVGLLIYMVLPYLGPIFSGLSEAAVSAVGLGALPIAAFGVAGVAALAFRRARLLPINLWVAGALGVIGMLGALAFFQPYAGALAPFTLHGVYSLGGNVGDTIIGSRSWVGALRVFAIFALAATISLPALAFEAGRIAAQGAFAAYLGLFMAVKSIFDRGRGAAAEDTDDLPPIDDPLYPRSDKAPGRYSWRDGLSADADSAAKPPPFAMSDPSDYLAAIDPDRVELDGEDADSAAKSPPLAVSDSPDYLAEIDSDRVELDGEDADSAAKPSAVASDDDDSREAAAEPLPAGLDFAPLRVEAEAASDEQAEADAPLARNESAEIEYGFEPEEAEAEREADEYEEAEYEPELQATAELEPVAVERVELREPALAAVGADVSEASHAQRSARANRYWDIDGNADAPSERPQPRISARPLPLSEQVNGGESGYMWRRPDIEMLARAEEMPISQDELSDTSETITSTLADYGVDVEIGHVRPGPTVTMYGLVPGWIRKTRVVKQVDDDGIPVLNARGRQINKRVEHKTRVKVESILQREKDLALALRTQAIRIETPAMGKSLVGIEVPNPSPSMVGLRNVMESGDFQKMRKSAHLPIALGRGSGGEAVCFDLAKMPHMLVAGATGSGKSVCLNAIVSCLITEKTPAEMRLLLVDPKRVELTPYNGIPHLMAPVVVETDTVVGYLKGLIREMFDRYKRMEEIGVRNIEAYNKRSTDKMPFLCVVVDELADLMMTAAFDVEQSICRLAQLGRATGIHMIIATQRPSVDVVTGLIKANFPSRISFGVTSQVDSRTILDTAGADKLLGRGDMLFLPLDASKPSRVQSVFIGDEEISGLVEFWQRKPWPPLREIDLLGGEEAGEEGGAVAEKDPNRDAMMDKALELAMTHKKLSTSLLQRRLRIGYPRAARIMDQLEEDGIVGPSDGSKSRDVIINQD